LLLSTGCWKPFNRLTATNALCSSEDKRREKLRWLLTNEVASFRDQRLSELSPGGVGSASAVVARSLSDPIHV